MEEFIIFFVLSFGIGTYFVGFRGSDNNLISFDFNGFN